jgi:hypothetical protein
LKVSLRSYLRKLKFLDGLWCFGCRRPVTRGALTALGTALDQYLSKADPRMAIGKIVETSDPGVAKSPGATAGLREICVEQLCIATKSDANCATDSR